MLKKAGLIIGLCMTPLLSAHAASDGSGCGLGKVILEGKSGTGPNFVASFINGIHGNQTFAMSTGTAGCDVTTTVKNDNHERDTFIASNMDNLSVDVAQGKGDYLASLAQIMSIEVQDVSLFNTLAQKHYEELFINADGSEGVAAALDVAMASDSHLSKYLK